MNSPRASGEKQEHRLNGKGDINYYLFFMTGHTTQKFYSFKSLTLLLNTSFVFFLFAPPVLESLKSSKGNKNDIKTHDS